MSRALGALGWYAGLALLAGACTQTLDAGHNRTPDPCATGNAGPPQCPPVGLLDNLIGYWQLDDGAGSTVAYDSTGRGNEGTLHGLDPNSAWVAGRWLGALEMARAGWVQVAPSPSIDSITDHITLSVWVNLESALGPDTWGTVLSRQIGTTNYQHYHIALYSEAQPSLFLITTDGFVLIRPPDPVPMGAWTHLAGVYDGAVARLYVNGAEVGSQALTGRFAADTTPIILGGNCNDASGVPDELVPGRLDELMVYARALSVTEIGQLAAGALFPPGPKTPDRTESSRNSGGRWSISLKSSNRPDSTPSMGSLRLVHSASPAPASAPPADCLETFDRELNYVFGTLQRLGASSSDVEDLLQEVFVVLHRHWPTLDTTRSLRPWLFGVAFRVVRAHRRRIAREAPYGELDLPDGAPTPEAWLQGQESLALLSAALQHVPASRRSVVIKHDLEGLDVVDIARALSLTKFGVYARLYKGRKELASAVRRLQREGLRR